MTASTPLVSYAQNFEDVILWRALRQAQDGFYIDVGAQDPREDSVSLGFYEKGWRGVHVEPTLHYAEKLRAARPDETVIQAAIAANAGLLHFYEVVETGLSTGDAEQAEQHRRAGFTVRATDVPSMPLGALLDRYADRPIHWLKIDVEGFEQQVIESWGASPVRPWVVVVESVKPGTQIPSHEGWDPLLTAKGYRFVHFDGLNRYYLSDAHPELAIHFRSGPNVFDEFVLSGTSTNRFGRLLLNRIDELQGRFDALEADRRQLQKKLDYAEDEARQFHLALDALHQELEATVRRHEAESAEANRFHRAAMEDAQGRIATYDADLHEARMAVAATETWANNELALVRGQLAALLASSSWRYTRPLRVAARVLARAIRLALSIPARARRIPRRLVEEVRKRPALKRLLMGLAARIPGLASRLRRFANPPAGPSVVRDPIPKPGPSQAAADQSHLTASARGIRARLTARKTSR